MKKLFVCIVVMMMALCCWRMAFAADPTDPTDPNDVDFCSIEALDPLGFDEVNQRLGINALGAEITVEENDFLDENVYFGFKLWAIDQNGAPYGREYDSGEWVDQYNDIIVKPINTPGKHKAFFLKNQERTPGSFSNFVNNIPGQTFKWLPYLRYSKNGEHYYKYGYDFEKTVDGWSVFKRASSQRKEKPIDKVVSSKIFTVGKFEISFPNFDEITLNCIKGNITAKGADGKKEYHVYDEYYSCQAQDFCTKDVDGIYIITKDGVYKSVGFKENDQDKERRYSFKDFINEVKSGNGRIYVRRVIEEIDPTATDPDTQAKIVYRGKWTPVIKKDNRP